MRNTKRIEQQPTNTNIGMLFLVACGNPRPRGSIAMRVPLSAIIGAVIATDSRSKCEIPVCCTNSGAKSQTARSPGLIAPAIRTAAKASSYPRSFFACSNASIVEEMCHVA